MASCSMPRSVSNSIAGGLRWSADRALAYCRALEDGPPGLPCTRCAPPPALPFCAVELAHTLKATPPPSCCLGSSSQGPSGHGGGVLLVSLAGMAELADTLA